MIQVSVYIMIVMKVMMVVVVVVSLMMKWRTRILLIVYLTSCNRHSPVMEAIIEGVTIVMRLVVIFVVMPVGITTLTTNYLNVLNAIFVLKITRS